MSKSTSNRRLKWIQKLGKGYRGWIILNGKRVYLQMRASADEAYADSLAARANQGKTLRTSKQGRFNLAQGMHLVLEEAQQAERRAGTLEWYRKNFEVVGRAWSKPGAKYGEEGWATIPLVKLYPEEIDGFIRVRQRQGVSANTIRHNLRALNRVFTLAKRKGYLELNPLERVSLPQHRQQPPRPFSRTELMEILDFLRSDSAPAGRGRVSSEDADLIQFMYSAGLRKSEMAQLCGEDIDLRSRVVHVREAKRDPRQFPICDEAVELFGELRDWAEWSLPADWVIPGDTPKKRDGYIRRTFERWQGFFGENPDAIGVQRIPERLHPHNMRHTLGSHLGACGVAESVIQVLLGHKSRSSITQRYVTAFSPDIRKAAGMLWRDV